MSTAVNTKNLGTDPPRLIKVASIVTKVPPKLVSAIVIMNAKIDVNIIFDPTDKRILFNINRVKNVSSGPYSGKFNNKIIPAKHTNSLN